MVPIKLPEFYPGQKIRYRSCNKILSAVVISGKILHYKCEQRVQARRLEPLKYKTQSSLVEVTISRIIAEERSEK